MQRLASETAEERKIRLCRRREGKMNRRASESEKARLARDRARRRQRRATETAQERETHLTYYRIHTLKTSDLDTENEHHTLCNLQLQVK